MEISIRERVLLDAKIDDVWRLCTDISQMHLFSGFGPVPGIACAHWIKGNGERGSIRLIHNTDGSKHHEEVVKHDPPRQLEDRIFGMTSPFRYLVREAHDSFDFEASGNQTVLRRAFRFTLTSPIGSPIAIALLPIFRRALRRHHGNLADQLAEEG